MSTGRRWAGALLVALLGAFGFYALYVDLFVRRHQADGAWPVHARFHFLWAEGMLAVLSGLTVWGGLGPLRRGESWARGLLLGVVLVGWALPWAVAGWFLPGSLPPAPIVHVAWAAIGLALAGLALSNV